MALDAFVSSLSSYVKLSESISEAAVFPSNMSNKIHHDNIHKNCTKQKLNVVFDLDATIIYTLVVDNTDHETIKLYCCNSNVLMQYDINHSRYIVFYRPYLLQFLKSIRKHFNLYVYTHADKHYTSIIINMLSLLLGENPFIRACCRMKDEINPKDLVYLKIKPENTIIIDYNMSVWPKYKNNVVNIPYFSGPKNINYMDDTELEYIEKKLLSLVDTYYYNTDQTIFDIIKDINSKYQQTI